MSGILVPDKIYFFISEESHNIDKGIKPNEIPIIDEPRVEFIYTENIGSLRKIIPILKMYWNRRNTRIIIYDDDWRIPNDSLYKLVGYSNHINNRFHASGIAGNIYRKGSEGLTDKYVDGIGRSVEFSWVLRQPKQVDLLSSGMGLLVKPKFFHNDILNWKKYKEFGVHITDEHFINYMLALKKTPRFVVPISHCPQELPAPQKLAFAPNSPKFKHKQSQAWHNIIMEWRL